MRRISLFFVVLVGTCCLWINACPPSGPIVCPPAPACPVPAPVVCPAPPPPPPTPPPVTCPIVPRCPTFAQVTTTTIAPVTTTVPPTTTTPYPCYGYSKLPKYSAPAGLTMEEANTYFSGCAGYKSISGYHEIRRKYPAILNYGWTDGNCLHRALSRRHTQMIDILINTPGIDLDVFYTQAAKDGITYLMYSPIYRTVGANDYPSFVKLLDKGAKVHPYYVVKMNTCTPVLRWGEGYGGSMSLLDAVLERGDIDHRFYDYLIQNGHKCYGLVTVGHPSYHKWGLNTRCPNDNGPTLAE